jgi:hypothetical protein
MISRQDFEEIMERKLKVVFAESYQKGQFLGEYAQWQEGSAIQCRRNCLFEYVH